jgi:hypothetical protein
VFRDRRELAAAYPEPSPHAIQTRPAAHITASEQAWQRTWKWAGKPGIALALLLALLAGCSKAVSGSFSPGLTAVAILVLCGPGLGYTGWRWLQRDQPREVTPQQEYQQALAEWDQRATEHETTEPAPPTVSSAAAGQRQSRTAPPSTVSTVPVTKRLSIR